MLPKCQLLDVCVWAVMAGVGEGGGCKTGAPFQSDCGTCRPRWFVNLLQSADATRVRHSRQLFNRMVSVQKRTIWNSDTVDYFELRCHEVHGQQSCPPIGRILRNTTLIRLEKLNCYFGVIHLTDKHMYIGICVENQDSSMTSRYPSWQSFALSTAFLQ